jgi:hypothetical protein
MTSTSIENLPATWDDARDIPFFRITAALFPPEFCFGASALLGSYDDTTDPAQTTSTEQAAVHAASDNQPVGDLIPVRVRRAG